MTPNKNANKGMPNWIKINGQDQLLGSSECETESCCWPPTVTAEFWAVMNNVPLSCGLAVWLWTASSFLISSHSLTFMTHRVRQPDHLSPMQLEKALSKWQVRLSTATSTKQNHWAAVTWQVHLLAVCPAAGLDKDNEGGNMEKWLDYQAWGSLCLFIGRIQEG